MKANFAYLPPSTEETEEKVVTLASFTLEVRLNGHPIQNIPNHTIEGEKLELILNPAYNQICKGKKLQIYIGKWGTYESGIFSEDLMAAKDELPKLLKQIPDALNKNQEPDLLTGALIEQKITVHYKFNDASVTKKVIKKDIPAQVFFSCHVAPIKEIKTEKLRFALDQGEFYNAKYWQIDHFGWIRVPKDVTWSPAEIESAFCDLAKAMLQNGPIQDLVTWKYKKTTQICLE